MNNVHDIDDKVNAFNLHKHIEMLNSDQLRMFTNSLS